MRGGFKVAVIDDERASIELIEHALSFSPVLLDVTSFKDAEAALEYLRSTHVDVIVTDLRMFGMDGRELIREIRRFDRKTPIVLVSSEPISVEEALAIGATAFVPKDSVNAQLAPVVADLASTHHLPITAPAKGGDANAA